MQHFKYIILLMVGLAASKAHTQCIDSLPWFMQPFQFLVNEVLIGPEGQPEAIILFRSVDNPDRLIRGVGRLYYDEDDFSGSTAILSNVTGNMLMDEPDAPLDSENWPSGQPPFPMLLNGYIQNVDGNPLEPWSTVTVRVNRVFFEDLTE